MPPNIYQIIRIVIKNLKIHTDATNFQLGAVIIHEVNLFPFCGIILTDAQMSYVVTERELVITVETLKEFRTTFLENY